MITVGQITGASGVDYFCGGGAESPNAESYYLDAVESGEPPGVWSGAGAEALGLGGEVADADLRQVFGEYTNPITGEAIGRQARRPRPVEEVLADRLAREPDALPERIEAIRREVERSSREPVRGYDFTYSPVKSITVAHTAARREEIAAVRIGDADRLDRARTIRSTIEDALWAGNTAALEYLSDHATARAGRHGGAGSAGRWVKAPGLVTATFFQHTNRNVDPQLHFHNPTLNRVRCEDGVWRALDGKDLARHQHAAGAIAARVTMERLAAAGFAVEVRDNGARELQVVDEAVCALYSSRRREIEAGVAPLVQALEEARGRELTDLELHYVRQEVALATRRGKSAAVPETPAEMMERLDAKLVGVGQSLERVYTQMGLHLADGPRQGEDWSPEAVVSEALAACGEASATFRRADILAEIQRRLPVLGLTDPTQVRTVLEDLTDQALDAAVRVAGRDPHDPEGEPFSRPTDVLYAAPGTIIAEEALRRAAVTRGRQAADRDQVSAWLDAHAPTIGADQRAAVEGILGSDAALCVLVGPAGTGKSYATGALAHAWSDLTGGRVLGLAVSQRATEVLREDGLDVTANVAAWLAAQDRLAAGSSAQGDQRWRLGPGDVVLIDEASMVGTHDLDAVRDRVEAAGARIVLTGDPRQLAAVEAGGVLGLLEGHAETYTLSDVRRFAAAWEREASLRLRVGDVEALAEYDRNGRILGHDTLGEAVAAAATAAVADRLAGRSVVVVAPTNALAAEISGRVRDQLLALGVVEDGASVTLGRDQCSAGVGDLVQARRNDYVLGVVNRQQYRVVEVHPDQSVTVQPVTEDPAAPAASVTLPAAYVAADLQLGYASTAHAAQGVTVDTAHLVTDGTTTDAAGLYVGMTRGRQRNTAHVALGAAGAATGPGLRTDQERPSAAAVLAASVENAEPVRAALVEQEVEQARAASMETILGRIEAVTRSACQQRLDRHLDQLVDDGVLAVEHRAALGADQGTQHLSRLLRAVEQTGADPLEALRAAVAAHPLTDADSVAQVLSHRIRGGRELPLPSTGELPAGIDPEDRAQLEQLHQRVAARATDLGAQMAQEPPTWALRALGPVPADGTPERADWETRVGAVAAHREATGWADPDRPLAAPTGVHATERRASYTAAWDALGRPQQDRDTAAMSDGQLRIRVRAREDALRRAPAFADAAHRAAMIELEQARQDAVLRRAEAEQAQALGRMEDAERLRAEADKHDRQAALKEAAAEGLGFVVQARAEWAARDTVTLAEGERALREAEARRLPIGHEPDRTTAAEWLALDAADRQAEDQHRQIVETDVLDHDQVDEESSSRPPADLDVLPRAASRAEAPVVESAPDGGHRTLPASLPHVDLDVEVTRAHLALAIAADQASADATENQYDPEPGPAAAEAAETSRRRRDAADHEAAQQSAVTATHQDGDALSA